jgi:REP element-mobilizing transposase RayT
VHNRGVEGRDIYLDDDDRGFFPSLLGGVANEYKWRVFAYTEMTNHYHAFVQTLEPTLSRGMQALDGDYGARFNRRHRRRGPLFQGRFRAHLVEKESYLLEVARYVVLNPVRARMVANAGEWLWSSYRATAGLQRPPEWLDTDTVLDHFDPWDRSAATRLYREFVAAGVEQQRSPWENLRAGVYLGSERFIAFVEELTSRRKKAATEPVSQRNVRVLPSDAVARVIEAESGLPLTPKCWKNELTRLAFAYLARHESIATFAAIGEILDLSAPGARSLFSRAATLHDTDRSFRRVVDAFRLKISELKTRV